MKSIKEKLINESEVKYDDLVKLLEKLIEQNKENPQDLLDAILISFQHEMMKNFHESEYKDISKRVFEDLSDFMETLSKNYNCSSTPWKNIK